MPNAMELIQQIKDYFKAEHGLNVSVSITAHSSFNNIDGKKAEELVRNIHTHIGGEFGLGVADDNSTAWVKCNNWEEGCSVVIFHKPEVQ